MSANERKLPSINSFQVHGKIAMVTGAGKGIGKA